MSPWHNGPRARLPGLLGALLAAACSDPTPAFEPPPPPDHQAIADLVDAGTYADLEAATARVVASPRDAATWSALGGAYEVAAIHEEAERCYASAGELEPTSARHFYRAAICSALVGEIDRALEQVARVIELEEGYGPAWRRRGVWMLELGDTTGARAAFERAGELLPGRPDALVGLAQVALLDDDLEAALRHAEAAYALVPTDRYVRLVLGDALRRSGRAEDAAPHLAAGEGSRPTYADPWSEAITRARRRDEDAMQRAGELERKGRWAEALRVYEDVETRRPDDTNVLLKKGLALTALDRLAEAVRHFDEATRRFPGDYDILVGQADALRRAGASDEALRLVTNLTERWPGRAEAFLSRGRVLDDADDVRGARAAYREAARIAPEDLRGPLFEGQMLLRRQRPAEAAAALTPAALDPQRRPTLVYDQLTLQALVKSRAPSNQVGRVYGRAVEVHGDAAKERFTRGQGGAPR
ncbi:MAG: tetratricopeptide repeat protein [Planctomycetota bacterium]|nr:tetratricopeptide repeat protein [Planctomycetota bacterium]